MSEVLDCIKNRKSCRNFSQKIIKNNIIQEIVESAFKVPKSQAENFLHLFVLKNKKIIDDVFWFCPGLDKKPKLILIIGAYKKFIKKDNYYSYLQMGCSLQNILLSSYSFGLGSVPIGSANLVGIKSYLDIEPEIDLKILIAIGFPKTLQKDLAVDLSKYRSSHNVNYF